MGQLKIKDNNDQWVAIPTGGVGVPDGGNDGDVLVKSGSADYATEWVARPKKWGTSVDVTFPFTAPCDGVFYACVCPNSSGDNYIYIRRDSDPSGVMYAAQYNPAGSQGSLMFPMHEGETYSIYVSSNYKFEPSAKFYPLP